MDKTDPSAFQTIQQAINNENVQTGDLIYVKNGTYVENVHVNKSVRIIGENRETTIVEGASSDVFKISVDNVVISNLTIRSGLIHRKGIKIEPGSDNNLISHNKIIGHNIGINMYLSYGNLIVNNTISGSLVYAVNLTSSTSNVFSNNEIFNNDYGLYLTNSVNNQLEDNLVHSNTGYGITYVFSSGNIASGNTLMNNSVGIFSIGSKDNLAYHNNFVSNHDSFVISDPQPNIWDNSFEGNYWSEYNGIDLCSGPFQNETGSDGIGDTPHLLPQNNKDQFPLMGMFHRFKIVSQGEAYHVALICNSTISNFKYKIGMETGNKIVSFNALSSSGSVGFCRIAVPNELMRYPYIMLTDSEETVPTLLANSNETIVRLYFTYKGGNQTITIISSRVQSRYDELLANYMEVKSELDALNITYHALFDNYLTVLQQLSSLNMSLNAALEDYLALQAEVSALLGNLTTLKNQFSALNTSYNDLSSRCLGLQANLTEISQLYSTLLGDYLFLKDNFTNLNKIHSELSVSHLALQTQLRLVNGTCISILQSYNNLLAAFNALNTSYEDHLADSAEQEQKLQAMMYLFAAMAAILLVITTYLSKIAHEKGQQCRRTAKNDDDYES
ncbi:MAG: pectinesterase family protein [Candidatus Bathyarchaeota archaeon]|nr:pectinesterase family protein [Candidatus Bathyarchaeota archaeon]